MQWDNSPNAGFVNGPGDPWYPVNTDYETINVEVLKYIPVSSSSLMISWSIFQTLTNDTEINLLNLFVQLSALRREQAVLQYGAYEEALVDDNIFSFVREHEGKDR
jgi:hypothetical protein